LVHLRRAIELDPLNLNGLDNLAEAYTYTKQYAESIEQSKKVLEVDPTFSGAHFHLAEAYQLTCKYDLWLDEWEKSASLNKDREELMLVEAALREYAKAGYRGALKRVVALQEEQTKRIFVDPAWIAANYALLGENDPAFKWLEKAYTEKSIFLLYLRVSPRFDSVRSDPRYADLLKRMGLPQ
jgi:tetratricopeptide (TPR) repeat protein